MNHSTPGLPVQHQLPEFTQTHIHQVSDASLQSFPASGSFPMSQFFASGGKSIGAAASIPCATNILGTGCTAIMEKEITTHSSILAWEIPWTEEPSRL